MTVLRSGGINRTSGRGSGVVNLASKQMAHKTAMGPCGTICQPYSAQPGTPCGCKCMMYCAGK